MLADDMNKYYPEVNMRRRGNDIEAARFHNQMVAHYEGKPRIPYYKMSDDHSVWAEGDALRRRIRELEAQVAALPNA